MLSIKYSEIPPYLHRSGFYGALSGDNLDEKITIPANAFKQDDSVNSVQDFALLLRVVIFWVIPEIPVCIVEYCNNNYYSEWKNAFEASVPDDADIKHILPVVFAEDSEIEKNPIIRALESGRIEVVEYLVSTGHYRFDGEVTATAARLGRRDFLQLLYESDFSVDTRVCKEAAAGGHMDCLIYAYEMCFPWEESTFIAAIQHGHFDCMVYAYIHHCPGRYDLCTAAAQYGQLECLEYLYMKGYPMDEDTAAAAAQHGHLSCLQYAQQNRCPWDDRVTLGAAQGGHYLCLMYALRRGCPIHEQTKAAAAKLDSPDCLDLLVCQQLPLEAVYMRGLSSAKKAVWNNDVPMLRTLFKRKCHLDVDVVVHALQRGSLDCLKYLLEVQKQRPNQTVFHWVRHFSDCDADDERLAGLMGKSTWSLSPVIQDYVRQNKLFECHRFLHCEGYMDPPDYLPHSRPTQQLSQSLLPPCPSRALTPLITARSPPETALRKSSASEHDCEFACRSGNLDALHFLHEEGAVFGPTSMAAVAEGGHLGCVRFLRKIGCPWDEVTTEAAARGGHMEVLRYLLERGCPCNDNAVMLAAASGCQPCLQLLIEHLGAEHVHDTRVFEAAFSRAHFDCVQYLVDISYAAISCEFIELHSPSLNSTEFDNELVRCLVYMNCHGYCHINTASWAHLFDYVHLLQFTLCKAFVVRLQWESKWGERTAASTRTELNACFKEWAHACELDHLDCVQGLYERNAPFDDSTAATAAERGHVHLLKHMHDCLRCLSESAAHAAASSGQVETLKYLVSEDCPYSGDMVRLAASASFNSLTCLKYLIEDMGIYMHEDGSVFGAAFMRADLPCVRYLLFEACCPFMNFRFLFDMNDPREVVPQHKDAEFLECIRTAVEYAWFFDSNLVDYVYYFNLAQCTRYFMVQWWNIPVVNSVDTVRMLTSLVFANRRLIEGS